MGKKLLVLVMLMVFLGLCVSSVQADEIRDRDGYKVEPRGRAEYGTIYDENRNEAGTYDSSGYVYIRGEYKGRYDTDKGEYYDSSGWKRGTFTGDQTTGAVAVFNDNYSYYQEIREKEEKAPSAPTGSGSGGGDSSSATSNIPYGGSGGGGSSSATSYTPFVLTPDERASTMNSECQYLAKIQVERNLRNFELWQQRERALRETERVLKPSNLVTKGDKYASEGNRKMAIECYKEAVEGFPGTPYGVALAEQRLGRIALDNQNYEEAIERYKAAISFAPYHTAKIQVIKYRSFLGLFSYNDGNCGTEERVVNFYNFNDLSAKVNYSLGFTYEKLNDPLNAAQFYSEALKNRDQLSKEGVAYATGYVQSQEIKQAIKEAEETEKVEQTQKHQAKQVKDVKSETYSWGDGEYILSTDGKTVYVRRATQAPSANQKVGYLEKGFCDSSGKFYTQEGRYAGKFNKKTGDYYERVYDWKRGTLETSLSGEFNLIFIWIDGTWIGLMRPDEPLDIAFNRACQTSQNLKDSLDQYFGRRSN